MSNPVSWLILVGVGLVSLAIVFVLLFLRRGGARVGALPAVLASAFAAPLVAAALKMMWMKGLALVSARSRDLVPFCVDLRLLSIVAWAFSLLALAATVVGLALSLSAKPAAGRQAGPARATLLLLLAFVVVAAPLPLLYWDARAVDAFTMALTVPLESAGEGFDRAVLSTAAPEFYTFLPLLTVVVVFGILFLVVAALTAVMSWRRSYAKAVSAVGLGLAAFATLLSLLWLGRLAASVMTVRGSVPRSWAETLAGGTAPGLRSARVVGDVAAACEKGSASACALVDEALLLVDVDATGFALRRVPFSGADALGARLRDEVDVRDHRAVFIRARKELEYGPVAKAISAGCEAGADEIGFVDVESPATDEPVGLQCFVPPPTGGSWVVLRLAADGSIAINRTPLASVEDAEGRLRDIFQARSDKTLFVGASDAVPYGRVVEIVATARRAGAERVAQEYLDGGVVGALEEIQLDEGIDLGVEGQVPGGVEGGIAGGVVGGVVGGLPAGAPPLQAVRVGGQIKEPKKLRHVDPVYPPIARQARVQGVVVLECTISSEGRVTDVRLVRGIPLLDQAAIDAVRQWVYAPTLLNGVPVPVIMVVTVSFRL